MRGTTLSTLPARSPPVSARLLPNRLLPIVALIALMMIRAAEGGKCAAFYEGDDCARPRTLPCVGTPFSTSGNKWMTLSKLAVSGAAGSRVKSGGLSQKDVPRGIAGQLADHEAFGDASRLPVDKCAVVGSASRLNKQKLGKMIDSMDVVVRFNNAPTKRHEAAVGGKTSLRLTNNRYSGFREGGEAVMGKMKFCEGKSMKACLSKEGKMVGIMLKKKVHPINPDFYKHVERGFGSVAKGKKPSSSGYFAIVYMMHVCREVHVFGIGATSYNDMRKWYWDKYPGFHGKRVPANKRPKDMSGMTGKWARSKWIYATGGGGGGGARGGGSRGGGGRAAARAAAAKAEGEAEVEAEAEVEVGVDAPAAEVGVKEEGPPAGAGEEGEEGQPLLGGEGEVGPARRRLSGKKKTGGAEDYKAEGQCLRRWAAGGFITMH